MKMKAFAEIVREIRNPATDDDANRESLLMLLCDDLAEIEFLVQCLSEHQISTFETLDRGTWEDM